MVNHVNDLYELVLLVRFIFPYVLEPTLIILRNVLFIRHLFSMRKSEASLDMLRLIFLRLIPASLDTGKFTVGLTIKSCTAPVRRSGQSTGVQREVLIYNQTNPVPLGI